MPRDAARLQDLPNLGPKTAAWLRAVGVANPEDLRRRGAVPVYVALKRSVPRASLNALYALAGAIEGRDWRTIRRTRKLELLLAVEDYERAHPAPRPASRTASLAGLRNIGPAMLRDLELLGVRSVAQLARRDADALYLRLQRLTGRRQDPCVWDTFAAAIHQARTGEALPWWHFTRERKRRQAEGTFVAGTHARAQRPPKNSFSRMVSDPDFS
ncbi:MAG: helix-hairpin-helix domain-containing protein [Pseudomonadota bacterium]